MRSWIQIFLLSACTLFAHSSWAQPQLIPVRENQTLPFEQLGSLDLDYSLSSAELQQWEKLFPFVRSLISERLIREISTTKTEESVLASGQLPARVSLSVVGANANWVVYGATLRELPAPPAVERRLKVYLIGLNSDHQLLPNQIIVTVEGDRLE